jgi:hypothetical protein
VSSLWLCANERKQIVDPITDRKSAAELPPGASIAEVMRQVTGQAMKPDQCDPGEVSESDALADEFWPWLRKRIPHLPRGDCARIVEALRAQFENLRPLGHNPAEYHFECDIAVHIAHGGRDLYSATLTCDKADFTTTASADCPVLAFLRAATQVKKHEDFNWLFQR